MRLILHPIVRHRQINLSPAPPSLSPRVFIVQPRSQMHPGEVREGRKYRRTSVTVPSTRKKKKKKSGLTSLPEDIIFNILAWLPADILFNLMTCVCRQWYKIIRDPIFIKEHLLRARARTVVFVQDGEPPLTAHCLEMGKANKRGGFMVSEEVSYQFPSIALASCDGLVMFADPENLSSLHLVNPVTKHKVTLPPFSWFKHKHHFTMACTHSSGQYKVVSTYCSNDNRPEFQCMILTIGRDYEWKEMGKSISDPAGEIFRHSSVSAGGFVYWADISFPYIVTLDVEAELFSEFPPPIVDTKDPVMSYFENGNTMSCFVRNRDRLLYDVWMLSDPKSGNWRKLYKIDLEVRNRMFPPRYKSIYYRAGCPSYMVPFGWMKNGEVVVFCFRSAPGPFIAHSVKTGETRVFGYHQGYHCSYFSHEHVNSLVSIDAKLKESP